jgi:CRISPR system Cascade subunit CasB
MTVAHWNAASWWRDLQPDPASGRRGDRAALARLRRCASVAEAMQEAATIALFRRVGASGPCDLQAVALAAAVLAHVREDRPGASVARAVGPISPDKPETATLKAMRFRRLMEADGLDERLTAFRRLAALAGGALPVADLAAALLDWSERRRRRWLYDYWDAGTPADLLAAPTQILAKDPAP